LVGQVSGGHLSEEAQEARLLTRRNSTQKFSKQTASPSYIYSMRHNPNKVQVLLAGRVIIIFSGRW